MATTPAAGKTENKLSRHQQAAVYLAFINATDSFRDTCTWYGTTYNEKGDLNPCGAPTVGAGLFCDITHQECSVHHICERHKQSEEEPRGW